MPPVAGTPLAIIGLMLRALGARRSELARWLCAVPGKDLHNNTIRVLELSLQAAGTDE